MRLPRVLGMGVVAALLVAFLSPSDSYAQFDTKLEGSVQLTASLLSPFDLYDGFVDLGFHRPVTADGERTVFGVRSRYAERLEGLSEYRLGLRLARNDRAFLELRGGVGSGTATASLSGGVRPRTSEAVPATWSAWEALAGVRLVSRGRVGAFAYAGPSRMFWTIEGEGRGAPAETTDEATGTRYSIGLPWAEASGSAGGWTLGSEARITLGRHVALVAAGEYRFGSMNLHRPTEDHAARLQDEAGDLASLDYERSDWGTTTLRLGVHWTFARTTREDPGERAVASLDVMPPDEEAPPPVATEPAEVRALLAAGDTAAAIDRLGRLLLDRPDDPSVVGTLGILLAASALSTEADFRGRLRAEEVLERALALDPGNPRFLLAYGLVLEKRGVERDARRVTTRAIAAAAARPGQMTPEELAEAFYRRAVSLETHVQEFEGLRRMPPGAMPLDTPECLALGAFCLNFLRPGPFYDLIVGSGAVVEDLVQDERAALIEEYGRALALVPAHEGASRRLMALHARAGEWEAVLARARAYRAAAPGRPWASILLGMALVWTGDPEAAERHFDEGIGELGTADRAIFEDLRPLLTSRREAAWDVLDADGRSWSRLALWERQDPLYLTEASEREQEHYARVALAELLFGEEQTGRRGWESDRGQILVRYGRPDAQWQLYRNDAGAPPDETGPTDPAPDPLAPELHRGADPYSRAAVSRGGTGGGRWIFWKYARDEPAFIFEKQLGFTGVRHMFRSQSFAYQQELKGTAPSQYDPPFRDAGPIPHQVVRFRGDAEGEHEVAVFAAVPADALVAGRDAPVAGRDAPAEAAARDSVVRGFFLRRENALGAVARVEERVPAVTRRFDVRADVPPGVYHYSIEAARPDHSVAAVERGSVIVGGYSPSPLALSDLLVGTGAARAAGAGEPSRWREIEMNPLRCMRVPEDRSIALVFEIYGLRAQDGLARYGVELSAGEAPATSFAVRILRGLRNLVDAPGESALAYERVVKVEGPRAVEWFQVDLGEDLPDEVELRVRVRDLAAGAEATTVRTLHRDRCASPTAD